jgi:hypothetical protein
VRMDWMEEWVGTEGNSTQAGREMEESTIGSRKGKWEDRRRAAARSTSEAVRQPPEKRALLLHEGLHKVESSIFTQIRTGKIGLADFVHGLGHDFE